LQKVLAGAGVASRRDCEELISAGRVTVNGRVVRVLGARVDPDQDEIAIDGRPVAKTEQRTYLMLNKPRGVVSTAEDTHGRPTVVELVGAEARVFPVGRLDLESEGLLLLTDDGALTQRLTHPSFAVEKEYRALLNSLPSPDALRAWRTGVDLDGVPTSPAWVDLIEQTDEGAWVRVVLHEGRKRQIREVARLLGYEVLRLIRVREGPLALGDLPSGAWRALTSEEVAALWDHVGGRPSEEFMDNEQHDLPRPPVAPVRRRPSVTDRRAVPLRRPRPIQAGGQGDSDAPPEGAEPQPRTVDASSRPLREERPRDFDRPPREGGRDFNRPPREGYGRGEDRPRGNYDRPREGGRDFNRPPREGSGRSEDRPRGNYDRGPREGGRDFNRPPREGYGRDFNRGPRDAGGGRDFNRPPREGYGRDFNRGPRDAGGGRDFNRPPREGYGRGNFSQGERGQGRPFREGQGPNDRPPRPAPPREGPPPRRQEDESEE
jgi:23S rRNA pseudouridine2605 synthase